MRVRASGARGGDNGICSVLGSDLTLDHACAALWAVHGFDQRQSCQVGRSGALCTYNRDQLFDAKPRFRWHDSSTTRSRRRGPRRLPRIFLVLSEQRTRCPQHVSTLSNTWCKRAFNMTMRHPCPRSFDIFCTACSETQAMRGKGWERSSGAVGRRFRRDQALQFSSMHGRTMTHLPACYWLILLRR